MNNLRITVTGATGFIGTHLVNRLRHTKVEIRLFNRQVHDFSNINSIIPLVDKCNVLFHLAGNTSNSSQSFFFNTQSTRNLLSAISKTGTNCKFIFASSFAVYRDPMDAYGQSKRECEKMLEKYPNSMILRLANVYGPEGNTQPKSVVNHFIRNIINNQQITINENGEQKRDYIYIKDVTDALLMAAKTKYLTHKRFNICSGQETTVLDLVSLIEEITGNTARVKFNKSLVSERFIGYRNNTLAKKVLKWAPKVDLSKGIRLTIKNYESV
jgi:UDP-glucose 4-epimerase